MTQAKPAVALELSQVSFRHKGSSGAFALDGVDLEVPCGQVLVLCGRSGCGKTTVTRLLNGLIPQFYEGELWGQARVFGSDPSVEPLARTASLAGSVFQNPRSQFFNVDSTSELAFGCENMGWDPARIDTAIAGVVERFDMEELLDRSLFKLSGGERQKVACAGVSAHEPRLLVLDEPASNLDQRSIKDLADIMKRWKAEGRTIVVSEHRLGYLLDVADRFVLMEKGHMVWDKSRREMAGLSEERLHAAGLRSLRPPKLAGSACDDLEPAARTGLELRSLRFAYRESPEHALEMEGLSFPRGSVTALVGDNGAGKTTLARCLCGLERRCEAEVAVNGRACTSKERRALSYLVMQDVNHQLFTESVREEVALSLRKRRRRPLRGREAQPSIEAILSQLDLSELADRHPMALSGGQKQRVAIASAVASERELCVFDEPTSGLDYRHMQDTARNIRSLSQRGTTCLVITHDPELVAACCDHAVFMREGRAAWWGRTGDPQISERLNAYFGG